jgi:hypothetical protein
MICPVQLASEMSALRAVRVGDHAEHGKLLEGRGGAGDESAGSNVAGEMARKITWYQAAGQVDVSGRFRAPAVPGGRGWVL